VPARVAGCFTGRFAGGSSSGAFGDANLALHVGDDPSAVLANRAALAARVGVDPGRVAYLRQVHGRAVAVLETVPQTEPEADAAVTAVPGLALAVLAADCVPVLLADARTGVVGAVHAGCEGVRLDVVDAAVEAMRELGAVDLAARIGPHIGRCCYEVGAAVQAELGSARPETTATARSGRPSLDLTAGVLAQLAAAGVTRVHTGSATCTVEDATRFSYRRDGVTGRHAGVVVAR